MRSRATDSAGGVAARALLECRIPLAHEKGQTMTDINKHGTLSVTGTGTVKVAPDEAVIDLGVTTDGRTAAEATAANARQAQAVIDAVSSQPNHGVTTMGLSVSPIMSYDPNTQISSIVGFRATNGVEVKTKIAYAGKIYDAGLGAGATQSSGITFRVQNEAPYREEALRLAIGEAFKEAKIVAKAAEIDLRGPESIQIQSGGGRLVYRFAAIDKASATPVLPEEKTITATVQVLFRTRV